MKTKTTTLLLAAALAATGVGCARTTTSTPFPVAEIDSAVNPTATVRQWPAVSATYANGSVEAGNTLFRYDPVAGKNEYTYYYADIGTYLANLATMPYTAAMVLAHKEPGSVVYKGVELAPSHYGVPPLPPSQGPAPVVPEPTTEAVPATTSAPSK
jgi:hypothetical protein